MIYLSGAVRPEIMEHSDMGYMLTPAIGNKADLANTHWAADTGCFRRPDSFRLDSYLNWLTQRPSATCLLATAPDVVGDAPETMKRALPCLEPIRRAGFRAALVAQDGLENMAVPWDDFDALFVGGTTEWKLSEPAYALAAEAKARGKWAHMGRVNSFRRIRAAFTAGYDSVDGTYLAFGPNVLFPKLRGWMDALKANPSLMEAAG